MDNTKIKRIAAILISDNGTLLREYPGKVDIEDNDYGSKVLFDNDGKRYIIFGGTVIVEEN